MITIGVDPGPHPGICVLGEQTPILLQTEPESLLPFVGLMIEMFEEEGPIHLAIEQWAIGPISRAAQKWGKITRQQIGELAAFESHLPGRRVLVHLRTASDVFPWASDARLAKAGLLSRTAGLEHARSAARHALFSLVRDTGAPDPLSRAHRS
jgi:hypothetical protein